MTEGARRLHFIGVGGITMSSLAAISHKRGYIVTGSDRGESEIISRLRESGIIVYIGHDASNVGECDMVVYTAAIADDNIELDTARRRGIPCVTRAVYLGWLMHDYKTRIGIAGTHGKSTATSMTACIMLESGLDPTVVSGAEFAGLDSGGQVSAAYRQGGKNCFIFEACEYTDSFLSFFPTTAVVTNVELDHVDYFHSLEQYIGSFTRYMNIADTAVVNFDSPNARSAAALFGGKLVSFGITAEDALYSARGINYNKGCARFKLTRDGIDICDIALSVEGEHNIYNAMAAAVASLENGASPEAVSTGLAMFCGARRRFEFKGELDGARVYDDYAHHPTEIRATLAAARRIAGRGRIICVFQPHSLSRTTGLFDGFTKAFGDADIVVFTDIYENLEHDNGRVSVTSADLAAAVNGSRYIRDFDEITAFLQHEASDGDIVITMGAGNIYRVCDKIIKK